MERKLAAISPFYAATTAMLAVTAVVAGCGGGTHSGASGQPSGSTRQAIARKTAEYSLAKSHLRVLTTLRRGQLCHALSAAEAVGILHARTAGPVYTRHPGVVITCQWIKRGQGRVSGQQLYVGISATINWTGTQAVDRTLHSRAGTIDGHPALAVARRGAITWAQLDVALGGANDPVAEYRAPTMAAVQALARTATPHIIALG